MVYMDDGGVVAELWVDLATFSNMCAAIWKNQKKTIVRVILLRNQMKMGYSRKHGAFDVAYLDESICQR